MSHHPKRVLILALAAIGPMLLSSCSAGPNLEAASQTASSSSGNTASDTSSSTSSSSVATTLASSSSAGTLPVETYRVGAYGYTSTSVKVYTRTILKVQFTPGQQDQTVVGTGFSPEYSRLGVYIGVGSSSTPTPMPSNGYDGTPVQSSQIIDLSSEFTHNCAATDTSCSTPVEITVSEPDYDYWCLNYGEYCPWSDISNGHPWHGTLSVQTDMTVALGSSD